MSLKPKIKDKPAKKARKSPLKAAYDNLNAEQKQDFFNKVCKNTGMSQATVYSWIRGATMPSLLEQKEVSVQLKMDRHKLFEN